MSEKKILTPLKAIRAMCLDCCYGYANEVRACTVETCALHPYRMGHRPKVDKIYGEDITSAENPT